MNNDKNIQTQIQELLDQATDKNQIVMDLTLQNVENLFGYISMIKNFQGDGYYFGVRFDQFKSLPLEPEDFDSVCSDYQWGESGCGRDFYTDLEVALREVYETQY